MDIIAYQDFHNIRLSDFYAGPDYREVENYDFMGEQWVGELSGRYPGNFPGFYKR
jgi:hypothetical protein